MSPLVLSAILAGSLFVVVVLAQLVGHVVGRRRLQREGRDAKAGAGAVEGAVFALLGLLIAFTFTGAAQRYDARRALIVEHVNALGTAWQRLDLLPAEQQAPAREQLRAYADLVRRSPQLAEDVEQLVALRLGWQENENEIWRLAVLGVAESDRPQIGGLVLPPLNESFDLTTTRLAAVRTHIHPAIVWLLAGLSVLAGLLAGHTQASAQRLNLLHSLIFAALISSTLYFILDFEYPRLGFITLDPADHYFDELLQGMR